jgi:hypothetical protein
MQFVLSIIFLGVGFVIGLFIYAQIVLPIIYGLPKAVYWYTQEQVNFMAIISMLITPVIWVVGLGVLGTIMHKFSPSIYNFVVSNGSFNWGSTLGLLAILGNMLTKKGRADMKDDYERSVARYKRL